MKIAVCIKRVPDTETRIKIGGDGKAIDEAGVKFVLNPYDEYAVEEALKLKEKAGSGEVAAIALGSDAAQETIRTALAMGADRGVLLKSATPSLDPLVTARALAAELEGGGFDLILFGKLAIDDYNQAVGTMVAELLGLPSVSAVSHLELADGKGTAEREVEGGVEVVEFTLPAVLTADKGLNEPRYPALKGIMAAKKKPLEVKPVAADPGGVAVLELSLPPARKEGRIVGEGPGAVPALIDALRNEAKVL
ncbi:MAG: electron transfer flavoprotein subunit beta/FixA family protein [Gemmatimonadetes bacterium]|nr:electron transfer flavoprotein subunit beta/FixA family protein [Gemmatimonadota bacterium]